MAAYNKIIDFVVSSATTSVSLSGFATINKGDFIKIVATIVNPENSLNTLSLFVNNETTTTDYRHHLYSVNNDTTNVDTNDLEENKWAVINNNKTSTIVSYVMINANDKFVARTNFNLENDTAINFGDGFVSSNINTTTITSFQITSSTTNGIGADSKIEIYKLDPRDIIEIETTEPVTQIDFTNLNITNENEYLLVANANNASGSIINIGLFVNNNTNNSDYRRVNIQKQKETTINTFRSSNSTFIFISSDGENAVAYCTIKLSQNNVFTYQSLNTRHENSELTLTRVYGTNVENTFETITKLNIVATSEGIDTNSKFTLYKLY